MNFLPTNCKLLYTNYNIPWQKKKTKKPNQTFPSPQSSVSRVPACPAPRPYNTPKQLAALYNTRHLMQRGKKQLYAAAAAIPPYTSSPVTTRSRLFTQEKSAPDDTYYYTTASYRPLFFPHAYIERVPASIYHCRARGQQAAGQTKVRFSKTKKAKGRGVCPGYRYIYIICRIRAAKVHAGRGQREEERSALIMKVRA